MKKIKTFNDACKALKLNPKDLPIVTMLPEKQQKAIIAHYKLIIIAQAINTGWEPNWNDNNENKYYPYFYYEADKSKPSGFGLAFVGCGDRVTFADVGSRLCFKSREIAKYAAIQFMDLYEDYFII